MPSLASDCKKRPKVLTWCRETNSVCLTEKIAINHQIVFFDLNVFDSMLHTISFQASVQSFFIWVAEVPQKNSPFSAVLFFSASAPFFLFAVLQSLSLLFLCKHFWAGKRNSRSSWKSLFAVEENYFIRVQTSLISLQWVMYEGSFQVRDGRWWKKIQECQTLKLGDAQVHPQ